MSEEFDIESTGEVRRNVIAFPTQAERIRNGIFDIRTINDIRELEQHTGKILLPIMLEAFVNQMQEKLQELSQSILKADARNSCRSANAINSMSTSIGALKVRSISSQLEAGYAGAVPTDADQSMASLADAYEEFVEHFRKEYISMNRDLI